MKIKDTIKELGLDENTLPRILQQRVATINGLQDQLVVAEAEHIQEPTEGSKENLESVRTYLKEYFEDVKEQLVNHTDKVAKKAKTDADAQAQADSDAKAKKDADAQKLIDEAKPTEEKKSSGLGALLIGGVLLVATLGVVNIMKNK